MKTLKLYYLALLLPFGFLTSCGDDDEVVPTTRDLIIAEWTVQDAEIDIDVNITAVPDENGGFRAPTVEELLLLDFLFSQGVVESDEFYTEGDKIRFDADGTVTFIICRWLPR